MGRGDARMGTQVDRPGRLALSSAAMGKRSFLCARLS
jgi:hypothetical protein